MRKVEVGTVIRHYNVEEFIVINLCRIESTLQTGVIFQSKNPSNATLWMRPLNELLEMVNHKSVKVSRYQIVE